MSHSSFITPAEHKIDLSIRAILYLIWGGLAVFGILTLIQPQWLQNISQVGRQSEALDLKVTGDALLAENKLAAAISKYETALETYPDLQTALGNLAIAYARSGKTDQAEKTINILIEKIPERAWIGYLNLGDIYLEKKDYEKARSNYQKSLENSPFPGNAYMFAAFCSKNLGDYELALQYYNQSIRVKSDFEQLYRGSLERDHFNYHDNEVVVSDIQERLLLESYQELLSRYDEDSFHMTLRRDPEVAKIYNEMGVIYHEIGDNEMAARAFRHALNINPNFKKALQNLQYITQ